MPCNADSPNPTRSRLISSESQSQYPGSFDATSKPGGIDRDGSNPGTRSGDKNEIPSQTNEGLRNVVPPKPRLVEPTPVLGVGSASFLNPDPSTSRVQGSQGMWMGQSWMICLTFRFSCTPDNLASDPTPSTPGQGESGQGGSSDVTNQDEIKESGSNLGSLVVSVAKLTLRGVKEAADAFPPLKAVAGGLCFILDNCEVGLTSGMPCGAGYLCPF